MALGIRASGHDDGVRGESDIEARVGFHSSQKILGIELKNFSDFLQSSPGACFLPQGVTQALPSYLAELSQAGLSHANTVKLGMYFFGI